MGASLRGTFTFDARDHVYRVGRWVVPGTSEVVRAAGWFNARYCGSEAPRRGTRVADLTWQWELGLVDLENVDGPERGYLLGYIQAMKLEAIPRWATGEAGRWRELEEPIVNRALGLATIPDRVGLRRMLNVKTGQRYEFHRIQRALEVMVREPRQDWWTRWHRDTLYLTPKGGARIDRHENPHDFADAMDALATWRNACHDDERHGPRSWYHASRAA